MQSQYFFMAYPPPPWRTNISKRYVDSWCFKFLCKVVGIKASYYSRIPNSTVCAKANYTTIPSQTLIGEQFQQLINKPGYSSQ